MTWSDRIAHGLTQLPRWLGPISESDTLETLLSEWGKASGLSAAGIVWPDANPTVVVTAGAERPGPRPEAGRPTVLLALPDGSTGRLWADDDSPDPWPDAARNYLALTARLMERSRVLVRACGDAVGPSDLDRRLADAGKIAGRITHDINNMLTSIIGFADLCRLEIEPGQPSATYVAEITRAGRRGEQFSRALWEFSRAGEAQPTPTPVGPAVAKAVDRLTADHPGVSITMEMPADLPAVRMAADPLRVVVEHALRNAAEAAPNGSVAVSGGERALSAADARRYLGNAETGRAVELRITDNGPGIRPAVRARLFAEPLFTTKPRHRGLGLAVVFRTLYAHRGGVRLDPNHPAGTVCRMIIPTA